MTELIESLLIFSRTGQHLQPNYESLSLVAERAIAMVRAHPDAHNVAILCDPLPSVEAWVDGKKVERALYNLLLNGCQAARKGSAPPHVGVSLFDTEDWIKFQVVDSGPGVSRTDSRNFVRALRQRRQAGRCRPGTHACRSYRA